MNRSLARLAIILCAVIVLGAAPDRADAATGTLTITLVDFAGYVHTYDIQVNTATGAFTGQGFVVDSNGRTDEIITGSVDVRTSTVLSWRASYTTGPYVPYEWWWNGGTSLVASDTLGRSLAFTMTLSPLRSVPALGTGYLALAAALGAGLLAFARRGRASPGVADAPAC